MQTQIIRYVKLAASLMLPAALMYFLFQETNIPLLLVLILAIALCTGLLFVFRVIVIPGSKEEREALEEQLLLRTINTTLNSLVKEAHNSDNFEVIRAIEKLFTRAKEFVLLLSGDDLSSVELVSGVADHIQSVHRQLKECNRLASNPGDVLYIAIVDVCVSIEEALHTMTEDYKSGRMNDVQVELTTLSRYLLLKGYIKEETRSRKWLQ